MFSIIFYLTKKKYHTEKIKMSVLYHNGLFDFHSLYASSKKYQKLFPKREDFVKINRNFTNPFALGLIVV